MIKLGMELSGMKGVFYPFRWDLRNEKEILDAFS